MKKSFMFIALTICGVAGATWAVAQDRSLSISPTRTETISAAPDGGVWALNSEGTLMFCRLEDSNRVQCYGKNGVLRTGY